MKIFHIPDKNELLNYRKLIAGEIDFDGAFEITPQKYAHK
jgi:hypothetical protein